MLKLYLVGSTNEDGDNEDVVVWAATRRQAIELWQNYWAHSPEKEPSGDVFLVPTTAPDSPQAVRWHEPDGMAVATDNPHPLVDSVLETRANRLKDAALVLADCMEEALFQHIYDLDNGDEYDPEECGYTQAIKAVREAAGVKEEADEEA